MNRVAMKNAMHARRAMPVALRAWVRGEFRK